MLCSRVGSGVRILRGLDVSVYLHEEKKEAEESIPESALQRGQAFFFFNPPADGEKYSLTPLQLETLFGDKFA